MDPPFETKKKGNLLPSAPTEPARTSFEQLSQLLPREQPPHLTEDHLQSVLSLRRGRNALFGQHLFSDPAWDVLLELYAAHLGSRRMSLSELARAVDVPQSVTARWITTLVNAGVVASETDPTHPDEPWIELTKDGVAKMGRLIEQWGSAFLTI